MTQGVLPSVLAAAIISLILSSAFITTSAATASVSVATCQCNGCPTNITNGGLTCSAFTSACLLNISTMYGPLVTDSTVNCFEDYFPLLGCQSHMSVPCAQIPSPSGDLEACNATCVNLLGCNAGTWGCSDAFCFPAHATVELPDGTTKTMAQLEVGDRVLAEAGTYSDVYMFSHRYAEFEGPFVAIATESGEELLLSADHYLYVNGKLAVASTVRVGDRVVKSDGGDAVVSHVTTRKAAGLYNPHTMHGDIVVNGITTSTYTAAVEPSLAHSLLWPARMLYQAGVTLLDGVFDQGSEAVVSVLPSGKKRYD